MRRATTSNVDEEDVDSKEDEKKLAQDAVDLAAGIEDVVISEAEEQEAEDERLFAEYEQELPVYEEVWTPQLRQRYERVEWGEPCHERSTADCPPVEGLGPDQNVCSVESKWLGLLGSRCVPDRKQWETSLTELLELDHAAFESKEPRLPLRPYSGYIADILQEIARTSEFKSVVAVPERADLQALLFVFIHGVNDASRTNSQVWQMMRELPQILNATVMTILYSEMPFHARLQQILDIVQAPAGEPAPPIRRPPPATIVERKQPTTATERKAQQTVSLREQAARTTAFLSLLFAGLPSAVAAPMTIATTGGTALAARPVSVGAGSEVVIVGGTEIPVSTIARDPTRFTQQLKNEITLAAGPAEGHRLSEVKQDVVDALADVDNVVQTYTEAYNGVVQILTEQLGSTSRELANSIYQLAIRPIDATLAVARTAIYTYGLQRYAEETGSEPRDLARQMRQYLAESARPELAGVNWPAVFEDLRTAVHTASGRGLQPFVATQTGTLFRKLAENGARIAASRAGRPGTTEEERRQSLDVVRALHVLERFVDNFLLEAQRLQRTTAGTPEGRASALAQLREVWNRTRVLETETPGVLADVERNIQATVRAAAPELLPQVSGVEGRNALRDLIDTLNYATREANAQRIAAIAWDQAERIQGLETTLAQQRGQIEALLGQTGADAVLGHILRGLGAVASAGIILALLAALRGRTAPARRMTRPATGAAPRRPVPPPAAGEVKKTTVAFEPETLTALGALPGRLSVAGLTALSQLFGGLPIGRNTRPLLERDVERYLQTQELAEGTTRRQQLCNFLLDQLQTGRATGGYWVRFSRDAIASLANRICPKQRLSTSRSF